MPDTLTAPPAVNGLEIREFQVREVNEETRTFTGIAVPWGQVTTIGRYYREAFERGAVVDSDAAKVFWRHAEPIGKITAHRDTDEGWEITGVISKTVRGDEAYTLLRDGVVDRLSVGFRPVEHREETDEAGVLTVTRTKVQVREVSLTPHPAYDGAAVTKVRHITPEENTMTTTTEVTQADLEQVREETTATVTEVREEIQRSLATLRDGLTPPEPQLQFRTAGDLLKAIVRGDEAAVREYNDLIKRAYTGATSDDTVARPGWVGDLTRLVDEAADLAPLFSTGNLPAEGMTLEYAQLQANTVDVDEQEDEGDDLTYGKVTLTTESAAIKTFGGYTQLTRQQIERSSVQILNHSLRALAIAAGKRRNATLRAHFATAVAAQVTAGNTVDVADADSYVAWVSAIVDAAINYQDQGLSLDALVADPTVFKQLAGLVDTAGRPLMTISGQGVNAVGTISPKSLGGDLAGVNVRLNAKQAAAGAAFVNRLAIRAYNSPVTRLQDENVINLSRDFSVYFYSAIADEIPSAIVPVEIGA